jgi:hypothetical protein
MKKTRKLALLGLSLPALLLADLSPDAPLGVGFVREAAAIIGAPLTPVSVAGAARRTTRRVVAVEATAATTAAATAAAQPKPPPPAAAPAAGPVPVGSVIHALPPGCVATPIGGVEYYNCAPGVYYRAAFQGNNLVYVSAQP